ncbi:Seminal metalloprotease 1, partial [Gryllus bimaculatus]
CAAPVGYVPIGRPIDLYLGQPGCQRRGTVQHEFLHTLGFWHEHTRPDRDQHVTVHWANIKPGLEFNFFVRPAKDVQYLRMPYDYGSVMHYRSVAFSKDGRSHTLEPKEPRAVRLMGQRMRFSKIDLAKLNRLYNCPPHYYRGNDVQIKRKKSSLYGTSVVERISSKEEEETNEEWEGPYPLNTTLELPGVFTLVPPPLPEISTAPPSTEVPKPPKLPTPSPLPAPPATATQPPVSPQPTIVIIPPTQPALPEPTEPPAPIPPPPEPPKLVPIVTVQPAPSSVPEPPSPPDTLKLPGALEPSPLPTPEMIIFPPSPVTEAPFPPLPSIPPPPPLLPLPTLPPHTAPASPIPPLSAAASPGPEGPVYIVEEKTGECARALQGASENALGAAGANANATATALGQLFLHLAGLSPWKLSGAN